MTLPKKNCRGAGVFIEVKKGKALSFCRVEDAVNSEIDLLGTAGARVSCEAESKLPRRKRLMIGDSGRFKRKKGDVKLPLSFPRSNGIP